MTNNRPHLRAITNQDGAVILDTKLGKVSTLNSTAAYIWRALERGENVGQIVGSLAQETGEDVDAIERDVQQFIDTLREQQLLPH
jgi:hypothetical protein